jgi:hypothetical protein
VGHEAADVDDQAKLTLDGQLSQGRAELPCVFFAERGPLQFALLPRNALQVLVGLPSLLLV